VSLLLGGGADFNAEDEEGLTPLQNAVRRRHMLERLLLVQDSWIRQHETVIELLQKYKAAQRRLVNMGQKRLASAVQCSI
jgi:ankyrin repeat protein